MSLLTETPPQTDVRSSMLLMQASQLRCALPITDVVEVMRPLPVSPMPGVPPFVRGVAVIRGLSVPVVDLGMLLGAVAPAAAGRWVVLRLGERRVALAVEAVRGVVRLEGSMLASAPPLLRDARAEFIETMGVMDQQLYLTLNSGRILGHEVWLALATQAASS